MKRFIANDESKKNSYGFHVLTAGIDIEERFKENPVCLNNHLNDTKNTLGTWVNLEIKDGKLSAEPKFDTEDADGKEVVRKVGTGTLKGCSMGIMFHPDDLVNDNGKLVLKKCILFEISIVAVPSNASAIALYNPEGELLTEQEVKSLCLNAQTFEYKPENTMKKLIAHLQLSDNATEDVILEAVKTGEAKLTASENKYTELKTKYDALITAETAKLQAEFDKELADAEKDGRIVNTQVESFKKLELSAALDILKGLPKRKTVESQMEGEASNAERYQKLSYEELRKQDLLAPCKEEFPEIYEQKFVEKFGHKPGENKGK